MPNTSVPAAGEAMPIINAIEPLLLKPDLRKLLMKDLLVVYDALIFARDAFTAVACQPRCDGRAEDVIDDLIDRVHETVDMVIEAATSATPTDPHEIEHRAWLILKYKAMSMVGLHDISSIALSLAARYQEASNERS